MASVVEKLYPPIIGSSIPAFYQDQGAAKIAVPFSMNRAVGIDEVDALQLKIKTVQSNTYITTLTCYENLAEALSSRVATFFWPEEAMSKVRVGQYLKIQMAYAQIVNKDKEENEEWIFAPGYFSTVATVKFTSKPEVSIEGIDTNKAIYKKSYVGVYETTEDKSERPYSYIFNLYDRYQQLIETSDWQLHNSTVNNTASESNALEKAVDKYTFVSNLISNTEYFIEYGVRTINNLELFSPLYICMQIEGTKAEIKADLHAINNFEDGYIELGLTAAAGTTPRTSGSYVVQRADSRDNYTGWTILNKVNYSIYPDFTLWRYRDFTIEQGIKYLYCIQQYNEEGIYSDKIYANNREPIMADFEDMFLFDGKKQIKIRFNPKVSSFKANLLESKINTIGSKYPYIFRNGYVDYKEFPISGLISYLQDENNLFIDYAVDLKLEDPDLSRDTTPSQQQTDFNVGTTNLVSYNIAAERIFKLKLMNWLNDGKIKLFRSPTEGNYLVRLMNISLAPEDRLNRMLHTFSSTAYEVEEFSYENLLSLGFFNTDQPKDELEGYESVKIFDVISDIFEGGYKKLNTYPTTEYLFISAPPGTILRLGQDVYTAEEVIISNNGALMLTSEPGTILPNVFMTYENVVNSQEFLQTHEGTITYKYKITTVLPSEFESIKTISIKNVIETYIGPQTNICVSEQVDNISKEILKFFVLDFQKKSITEIEQRSSVYYLANTDLIINSFDPSIIYLLNNKYYIAENDALFEISDIDTSISLKVENGNLIVFNEPTVISLPQENYSEISFGNGINLNCAYQVKITEYNASEGE